MFGFLKKLFGISTPDQVSLKNQEAPYKVEPQPDGNECRSVNTQITDAVTTPAWHTSLAEGTKPVTITDALDVNKDGKVNLEDAKAVVKKTRAKVKKAADVDSNGKVTVKDAKAAVKKATPRRGRKPKSK
jgi:Ni,Fe-hydrogenase maturation factor